MAVSGPRPDQMAEHGSELRLTLLTADASHATTQRPVHQTGDVYSAHGGVWGVLCTSRTQELSEFIGMSSHHTSICTGMTRAREMFHTVAAEVGLGLV